MGGGGTKWVRPRNMGVRTAIMKGRNSIKERTRQERSSAASDSKEGSEAGKRVKKIRRREKRMQKTSDGGTSRVIYACKS